MKLNYTSFPSVVRQRRANWHRELALLVLGALCLFSIARWGGENTGPCPGIVSIALSPFRAILSGMSSFGGEVKEISNGFVDLQKTAQGLEDQVDQLQQQLLLAEQREAKLRLLRPNALVDAFGLLETEPAMVVGIGSGDYKTLIIDKGSKHGLMKDMPVITNAGLVGRLDRLLPNASRVLLLQDQNSIVGAEVRSESRELLVEGLVMGTGSNLDNTLRLEAVGVTTSIEGHTVYTSSLSVFFPPGLKIGRVQKLVPGVAQVFERHIVEPYVDIQNLRHVLVIVNLNREDAIALMRENQASP